MKHPAPAASPGYSSAASSGYSSAASSGISTGASQASPSTPTPTVTASPRRMKSAVKSVAKASSLPPIHEEADTEGGAGSNAGGGGEATGLPASKTSHWNALRNDVVKADHKDFVPTPGASRLAESVEAIMEPLSAGDKVSQLAELEARRIAAQRDYDNWVQQFESAIGRRPEPKDIDAKIAEKLNKVRLTTARVYLE